MKLKQRVILMSSVFLTMSFLFLIGIQLSWLVVSEDVRPRDTTPPVKTKEKAKVELEPELFRRKEDLKFFRNTGKLEENDFLSNNHRPPRKVLNDLTLPSKPSQPNKKSDPWKVWMGWVTEGHLYPSHVFYSDEMNNILNTMAMAQVTSFGVGIRGTQLKASVMFGAQQAVFKPKRCAAFRV